MKKFDLLEGKEYIVVSTRRLYEGFVGTEKWVIVSNLTEEELCEKYLLEIECFRPWTLITVEQYTVMVEWKRNEDKHRRRIFAGGKKTGKELFYGVDGSYIDKLMDESSDSSYCYTMKLPLDILVGGFEMLTKVQRERIEMMFIDKMTIRDIARVENVSDHAVKKSIEQGINKLRAIYLQD